MDITLDYLKKLWDDKRIARIKKEGMHLADSTIFFKKYSDIWPEIDAVWTGSGMFEQAISRRRRVKKKYDGCHHIFISEICNIAVEEYRQVANIMGTNKITLYIERYSGHWLGMSQKMLREHFELNYYNYERGELTASVVMV